MENKYNTEDFLAKWANGELSASELEAFEKSEEFDFYKSILEGTDVLKVPEYNKEALFNKVQEGKEKNTKVIKFFPKWGYAAAAAIAILIASTFFFNQNSQFSTGYGEQLVVNLPDGSEAILNAKSELNFDTDTWQENRKINLTGEAFFKVKKGLSFTVQTNEGSVSVLGTQFSVNTKPSLLETICYEGSVKVEKGAQSGILTKGQALRIVDAELERWAINDAQPSWLQQESTFNNAPLYQVIKALENQYDISINSTAINTKARFTGSFTHSDLDTALRTVFEPLEIKFTFKNENTIILVK